ncbi:DUF6364 family protein [Flavobacterium sp.]|uniref:DUF6364 family protein n=1 Tax=Flavobacterium sp. TaxID=239 RepID=UPI0037508547
MDARIVITANKQTIIDAKKIAKNNKVSLSKMFESYLRDLLDGKVELIISKK